MKALVINGPNLNMLGIREPGIYGTETYDTLVQICQDAASDLGFDGVEVFQSNHEGAIVDRIQEAYSSVDGIVINPAAYTHTSVAILDASRPCHFPLSRSTSPPWRIARTLGRYRTPVWPALPASQAKGYRAMRVRSSS